MVGWSASGFRSAGRSAGCWGWAAPLRRRADKKSRARRKAGAEKFVPPVYKETSGGDGPVGFFEEFFV